MRSLGFLVSSADLGFLAINLAKASFDGARMVTFCATDNVWTTSGTVWRRPGGDVSVSFHSGRVAILLFPKRLTVERAQVPAIRRQHLSETLGRHVGGQAEG